MVAILATIWPEGVLSYAMLAMLALIGWRWFAAAHGTTLRAPCFWILVSVASLAASGASWLVSDAGVTASATRFAAAVTTICPLMAVLGAKRPQDRGWQWVVLTLWIILVGPAAQAALFAAGRELELFVVWRMFLMGLVGLGLLNYLPTDHWLESMLAACGQAALLNEHLSLPATPVWEPRWSFALGTTLLAIAAAIAWWRSSGMSQRDETPGEGVGIAVWNGRWRSFRNAYGAFWALRVMARVNETAQLRSWPMKLSWHGFEATDPDSLPPTADQLVELETALATVFRRFLSDQDLTRFS